MSGGVILLPAVKPVFARACFSSRIKRSLTTWSRLASRFNSIGKRRPNFQFGFGERSGLFGHSVLQEPSGFYLLKDQAFSMTLSDALCRVADMAEFVRIGHPETRFSTAAMDASVSINNLVEKLNTDRRLYNALKHVVQNGDVVATTEEDDHVSKLFLFDFEQSGIHLNEATRREVVSLNDYALHVGSNFANNALQPRSVRKTDLPESVRGCFASDGEHVIVPGLYTDADNELVREAAYRAYLYPDEHQSQLLDELLGARHRLAQLCGFPSFAHRVLRGSIAGSPDVVEQFLDILSSELKPRADNDYKEMLDMKTSGSGNKCVLQAWDVPYYTFCARQAKFQLKASDYAPLGEVWHADVVKLAVKEQEGGNLLGHIYCDFFERQEKPNQDCHFTIQGGRVQPDGSYQLPVVVLMLNLASAPWGSPPLLSPSSLDNLFHEMGHAMHSMLARTRYQHVTGTRCATDLAEVPSILMEYFSSDPRVVSTFARHYQTGEPMPYAMALSLRQMRYHFAASETQLQVFYALLDQRYHAHHPLGKSTTELLADLQGQHYGVPYVPNTAWQLRFGHLVGYGAKYYAYLMSRAVAAWTWHELFREDPFCRTAGEQYRRELLSHGGAKPAHQLVSDFLLKEVTPESLASVLIADIDAGLT
ncbi:hypothetical protein MRX96_026944 [Rhipicephalus microplus]